MVVGEERRDREVPREWPVPLERERLFLIPQSVSKV